MTRELKVFPNTPPNHLEEKTKIINNQKLKNYGRIRYIDS